MPLARLLSYLIFIWLLSYHGGAFGLAMPVALVLIASLCLLTALTLPKYIRRPPLLWIALLLTPPLLMSFIQIAPLDLGNSISQRFAESSHIAFNILKTQEQSIWLIGLFFWAICCSVIFRGERSEKLAQYLVHLSALHVLIAIFMAAFIPEYPIGENTGRLHGFFWYPNQFAAFCAIHLPLAFSLASRKKGYHLADKLKLWVPFWLLCLGVILSGSRASIIWSILFMLPICWFFFPSKNRIRWFSIILACGIAYLMFIGIDTIFYRFERIAGDEGVSINGRLHIWQALLPHLHESGLFGIGASAFETFWFHTGDPLFQPARLVHAHNDWLEYLICFGFLGAMVSIICWLFVARSGWKHQIRQSNKQNNSIRSPLRLSHALLFGLGYILFHSFSELLLSNYLLQFCCISFLVLIHQRGSQLSQQKPEKTRQIKYILIPAAAILFFFVPNMIKNAHNEQHEREHYLRFEWRRAQLAQQERLPDYLDQHLSSPIQKILKGSNLHSMSAVYRSRINFVHDQSQKDKMLTQLNNAQNEQAASVHIALERLRWLSVQPEDAEKFTSLAKKILSAAPSWHYGLQTMLYCIASQPAISLDTQRNIHEAIIKAQVNPDPWFFETAEFTIGTEKLLLLIDQRSSSAIYRSALPWILSRCSEEIALEKFITFHKLTNRPLPPSLASIPQVLSNLDQNTENESPSSRWNLPSSAEGLRLLNEYFSISQLQIPSAAQEELAETSMPNSFWSIPIDLRNEEDRTRVRTELPTHIHKPWAQALWDQTLLMESAYNGHGERIPNSFPPQLIQSLLDADINFAAGQKQRLEEILQLHNRINWHKAFGCRSSWLIEGATEQYINLNYWTGLIVNGQWYGFLRGEDIDLSEFCSEPINRITLIHLLPEPEPNAP